MITLHVKYNEPIKDCMFLRVTLRRCLAETVVVITVLNFQHPIFISTINVIQALKKSKLDQKKTIVKVGENRRL